MSSQQRLHALDAVRAFALLSGIVLHATMSFFLPIPARDVSQSAALSVVFFVIHTFRMATFFVLAGLFARLVLDRRGARGFVRDRAKRILAPLVVGWLAFAPLSILAVIWGVTRTADPATRDALAAAATNAGPGGFPLVHLWFLYYLCWFYVVVLLVRAIAARLDPEARVAGVLDRIVRRRLASYVAPLVAAAPLFAVLGSDPRIIFLGGIPTPDSSLVPQVPALVGFGTAFALGWFVHRQLDVIGQWRQRWLGHLVIGIALSVACLAVPGIEPGTTAAWLDPAWSTQVYAAVYLASVWYWTFGVLGAGLRLFSRESAARRYLADSSYWLYLAHVPLVFSLQVTFALVPWHWAVKFPLIVGISLAVLLASYHYLVRPTWIGEILNGRKVRRARRTAPAVGVPHQPPVTATAPEPVAELRGVHKRYGRTTALAGLSLAVGPGELVALLGPNGAGKSTAIALWLGLLEADDGDVRLFGRSPLEVASRREVGVMLQEVVLNPTLRVRELVELAASYYPSPLAVHQALELTHTTELAGKPCGKLSAGQKRQAQFAVAICGRPRLLFLDEPTVGLDVQARELMWRTIRAMVAEGSSVLLTTHYLEEAEALADRVAVLARGELIASGTVDEVRSIVSRKRITCTSGLGADDIRTWPDVVDATGDTRRLEITAIDAESVVRRLLAADHQLKNLEVRQAGLAEAVAELTREVA